MIISYREYLLKNASNPSSSPWNVSPTSKPKQEDRDETGTEEIVNNEFVKMKVHDEEMPIDKKFINWETINQMELPVFEEKEIKFTRSKK